ncbi:MAG: universal stress protein, partial [Planctomycetota bacterium]
MLKLERILVPIDFSPTARRALEAAAQLARLAGGKLYVLHVLDTRGLEVAASEGFFEYVNVVDAMRRGAEQELRALVDELQLGEVVAKCVVDEGTPTSAIRRAIDDHGVGLVVMGTHGRSGVVRWLLGSVAEKTVRTAPCPVLVVKP